MISSKGVMGLVGFFSIKKLRLAFYRYICAGIYKYERGRKIIEIYGNTPGTEDSAEGVRKKEQGGIRIRIHHRRAEVK